MAEYLTYKGTINYVRYENVILTIFLKESLSFTHTS